MKISINKTEIIKNADGKKEPIYGWRQFTNSFQNVDITPDQLIEHIQLGHSYAACHKPPRSTASFICAQHIDLDFDPCLDYETGEIISPNLNDLLNDKFIQQYASFVYTTFSHSERDPRYRVFFELERETCKSHVYEALRRGLIRMYSLADESCKDATHLMFGAKDCQAWFLGNTMPISEAQKIVNEQISIEKQTSTIANTSILDTVQPDTKHSKSYVNYRLQKWVDKIIGAIDGKRRDTRLRIGCVAGGGYAGGLISENELSDLERAVLSNTDHPKRALDEFREAFEFGRQSPIKA